MSKSPERPSDPTAAPLPPPPPPSSRRQPPTISRQSSMPISRNAPSSSSASTHSSVRSAFPGMSSSGHVLGTSSSSSSSSSTLLSGNSQQGYRPLPRSKRPRMSQSATVIPTTPTSTSSSFSVGGGRVLGTNGNPMSRRPAPMEFAQRGQSPPRMHSSSSILNPRNEHQNSGQRSTLGSTQRNKSPSPPPQSQFQQQHHSASPPPIQRNEYPHQQQQFPSSSPHPPRQRSEYPQKYHPPFSNPRRNAASQRSYPTFQTPEQRNGSFPQPQPQPLSQFEPQFPLQPEITPEMEPDREPEMPPPLFSFQSMSPQSTIQQPPQQQLSQPFFPMAAPSSSREPTSPSHNCLDDNDLTVIPDDDDDNNGNISEEKEVIEILDDGDVAAAADENDNEDTDEKVVVNPASQFQQDPFQYFDLRDFDLDENIAEDHYLPNHLNNHHHRPTLMEDMGLQTAWDLYNQMLQGQLATAPTTAFVNNNQNNHDEIDSDNEIPNYVEMGALQRQRHQQQVRDALQHRIVRSRQIQAGLDPEMELAIRMSRLDVDMRNINHNQNNNNNNVTLMGQNLNTYEELLQLEDVKVPFPRELLDQLPVIRFDRPKRTPANSEDEDPEPGCPICLEQFVEQEEIRILACTHRMHRHCIDHWFEEHCTCPVCVCRIDELLLALICGNQEHD